MSTRTVPRTITASRVVPAVIIALAVLLVAALGLARDTSGARAATAAGLVNANPVAAGPYHQGNISCAQDGTRINGTWDHHCPPGWHYAQVDSVDVYVRTAAPSSTSTTASTTTAATTTAALATTIGGTAPGLEEPVVVSTTALDLAWSGAKPAADSTITGYQVHYRPSSSATWLPASPIDLDVVSAYRLSGLSAGTVYYVQVRAKYTATSVGPWSAAVSGVTASGTAATTTTPAS